MHKKFINLFNIIYKHQSWIALKFSGIKCSLECHQVLIKFIDKMAKNKPTGGEYCLGMYNYPHIDANTIGLL